MDFPGRVLKDPGARRDSLSLDALYKAHGEGSFGNPGWESADFRALIVRLSPFRDVERSCPHLFLQRELRQAAPGAFVDFSFFPTKRDRTVLDAIGVPYMHGVASARGAADFDLVFISNSYTLELLNLVPFLAGSGLPLRAEERRAGGRWPLVVLGGSNAFASASLCSDSSCYVDGLFFGEGEESAGRLALALSEAARLPERSREAVEGLLEAAADRVPGFWPAGSARRVSQARAAPDSSPRPPPAVLAGEEALAVRLEITKGCPSFCSFCFEGWERKPYRERSVGSILEEARALKAATGADTVELASYNFNTHSRIAELLVQLNGLFSSVNCQSQRVDVLARVPGLSRLEMDAGKRSFTIGVEGLSEHARAYFNKNLSEADLKAVVSRLVYDGARELKLFYILSGYEGVADVAEFAAFVRWLESIMDEAGSRPRAVFSAGELVRMPFTPLAYEALALEPSAYAGIVDGMKSAVLASGFEYRAPSGFDEYRLSQVLALAPEGSFELLAAMADRGFVYDQSAPKGAWQFARDFLERRGSLSASFLGKKGRDYAFPFGFVDTAASRDAVYARFERAESAVETPSCLGGGCDACGACDQGGDAGERAFLAGHRLGAVSQEDRRRLAAVMEAKRKPAETLVAATLPREAAGAPPAYAASLFARSLMAAVPSLVDGLVRVSDAFMQSDAVAPRLPGASGSTVYRVLTKAPAAAELSAAGFAVVGEAALEPPALTVEAVFRGAEPKAAASAVSAWLNGERLNHTMVREGEGYALRVSDAARKRRSVLSAVVGPDGEGGARASFSCGPKFDFSGLAAAAGARGLVMELTVL